jgi:aminopeptidase N
MRSQTGSARVFAEPEARPQYARPRTYDVRHIRLELDLDEKRRHLQGVATLVIAPINDALRQVELDLSNTLHVDAVRFPGGRALRWEHREDRLQVTLPRPAPAGRDLQLAVTYHGFPRRGLYFVQPDAAFPNKPYQIWSQGQDEDSKFWFPCFDSPHEKATSEILARVRRPFQVISNGRLVEVVENGRGRRTFHWHEEIPHPAYLVSIAVGEFEVVRADADGVEVSYYVPRSARKHVERTFGRTPEMMRFFARSLDYPYPYEKYAQVVVQDFIFGGMENVSATTLTDAALLDEIAAAETHSDGLIAHELAHQWWGNLLTCKEWSHAWLNEGFATYFDALFTEHHRGTDEFRWQMHAYSEEYFREDEERYRRPIVERRYSRPIDIFDRHLYEKGALVLHMLRHELGDALFWKTLRHYVRKHQFQNVETADFKVAIEEATGRHMDAFFDQWVFSSGFPKLDVSWSWEAGSGLVALVVRQTQPREAGTPAFPLALDVELGGPRGSERVRVRVDQPEQTVYLPASSRPLYLRVDPEHCVLKQLQYEPSRGQLLAQLERARDLFGQVDAARGLARYVGDVEVEAALKQALGRARFHAVKGEIARALARLGGETAKRTLLAALADRDPRARRRIVRALAEFREDEEISRRLRALWERDRSYGVRAEILLTLARARGSGALPLCRRALRVPSFRDAIRAAALEALGELELEQGIKLAMQHARYGSSRWARDAAMKTLAALGRSFPQRARAIQDLLEAALLDRSFFGRMSATEALGRLARPQAVPALRRFERSDVDARLQRAAQMSIQQLTADARNPESWRGLQQELRTVRQENRDLRARLDRLEARLDHHPGRRPNHAGPAAPRRRRRRA